MQSRPRGRLLALAHWCVASWPAACAGALAAGLVEALAMDTPYEIGAGVGFIVMFTLPALLVVSLVFRLVWLAWRPARLAEQIVDPDLGSPALAGWLLALWLGTIVLGFATFGSTHLLAARTEFRPMLVGFLQPALTVAAALVVLACSRPAALGLSRLAAASDRRWRARGHATLLTPARVIVAVGLLAVVTLAIIWSWVPRSACWDCRRRKWCRRDRDWRRRCSSDRGRASGGCPIAKSPPSRQAGH